MSELQVNTSSFSAQYGIGGVILTRLPKGGTDHFHRQHHEYVQNDATQLVPICIRTRDSLLGRYPICALPTIRWRIGGPILKTILFDYDQSRQHHHQQCVCTTALMGGDFTGLQTIYDPTTQTIAYDSMGNSLSGEEELRQRVHGSNSIPANLFDPLSAQMQQFLSDANKSHSWRRVTSQQPAPREKNRTTSIQVFSLLIRTGVILAGWITTSRKTTA